MKAEMALLASLIFLAAIIVKNKEKTIITIEPEVPKSKTDPIMEDLIDPERAEETSAIAAKVPIGIRYLTFGISIIPVERTEDRKKASMATRPVARRVTFAAYKPTESAGTKNSGSKNMKHERMIPNFLVNMFSEL